MNNTHNQSISDFLVSLFEEAGMDVFENNVDRAFLLKFAKVLDSNLKKNVQGKGHVPSFVTLLKDDSEVGSLVSSLGEDTYVLPFVISMSLMEFSGRGLK